VRVCLSGSGDDSHRCILDRYLLRFDWTVRRSTGAMAVDGDTNAFSWHS